MRQDRPDCALGKAQAQAPRGEKGDCNELDGPCLRPLYVEDVVKYGISSNGFIGAIWVSDILSLERRENKGQGLNRTNPSQEQKIVS